MEAPPPGQLSAPVLWAERLGGFDAAWLALRTALTREEVRYDAHQATPAAARLADSLGWKKADLTLAKPGADGAPLNDAREELLARAVRSFARERLGDETPRLRSAFEAYYAGKLLWRATFLVMASDAARAEPGREHRYYTAPHPAGSIVDRASGLRVTSRPSLVEPLRQLATPFALLARAAWASAAGVEVPRKLTGKPAVWVEYYHLDAGGYISRFFWKDHVDPARFDRVVYMDREDSPADAAQTARVEALGLSWIDASRPWALAGLDAADGVRLLRRLFEPRRLPWWARCFVLHYEATVAVWEAAFRRFGVRVVSQHQELSWLPVAQAEAVERSGGAMMGLHWSDFPFLTEPTHPSPETVFFVWGVTNRRWLEGKGFDGRRILPCGLWLPDKPEAAAALKDRLGPAEFTLAVFDSGHDYRIFYSARMLADFVGAVLGLLDSRPGWKAVFKPKSPALYEGLPGGEELMRRLRALESGGRVVVTGHEVSPVDAALACGLSVCFGFNSAGVVAGARGARAVHWDAAGWTRHPLRSDPAQKILFRTLPELSAAVAAAPKDPSIGDFSRWRRQTDHFGDRRAPERVGRWLEDALSLGADAATERYAKTWDLAGFDADGEWWRDR